MKHLDDADDRLDQPVSKAGRLQLAFELEAARVIVERHKTTKNPSLDRLVNLADDAVEASNASELNISFLPQRDRLWLNRQLLGKSGAGGTRLAHSVIISASDERVANKYLNELVEQVESPAEREALAEILCNSDQCTSPASIENSARLIDAALAGSDEDAGNYLDGRAIAAFVREAGEEHSDRIDKLLERSESVYEIALDIPQRAFSEDEKCMKIAKHVGRIVRRNQRSSARLRELAECMFRLDRSRLASSLLDRAALFAVSSEQRAALMELRITWAALSSSSRARFARLRKAAAELDVDEDLVALAKLGELIWDGREPTDEQWAAARKGDALTALESRWHRLNGDWEQQLARQTRLKERYHRLGTHFRWVESMVVLRRTAELQAWLEGREDEMSAFARAALAGTAGDRSRFLGAVAELDTSSPSWLYRHVAWNLAIHEDVETALDFQREWTRFLSRLEQRRASRIIGHTLHILVGRDGIWEALSDRDGEFRSTMSYGWEAAGCPKDVAEFRKERLDGKPRDAPEYNSLSWCHIVAGRYAESYDTAPIVMKNTSDAVRDTRAVAAFHTGRYDEAADLWRTTREWKTFAIFAEVMDGQDVDEDELRIEFERQMRIARMSRTNAVHPQIVIEALKKAGMSREARALQNAAIASEPVPNNLRLADDEAIDAWEKRWQRRWPTRPRRLETTPDAASPEEDSPAPSDGPERAG